MKQKLVEIKNFISKNFKWIILLICIIIFFKIAEDVFSNEIMQADVVGYRLISTYLISDVVTPIAKLITNFGGTICLISLSIIFLVTIKNRKIGGFIALNLIIAALLNLILKNILQRPRPTEYRIIDQSGYSFPSGHSMVSMAFYGFLIYLIFKFVQNKKIKYLLISFLTILIILIGISRIYLGVHYTSDVLAGFLISISYLILYTSIIEKYIVEKRNKNEP